MMDPKPDVAGGRSAMVLDGSVSCDTAWNMTFAVTVTVVFH